MSTNGHHASPETGHKRRNLLMIGAIVVALLVFGGGYAIGRGNGAPRARRRRSRRVRRRPTHTPRSPARARARRTRRVTQRERVRDPEPDGRATRRHPPRRPLLRPPQRPAGRRGRPTALQVRPRVLPDRRRRGPGGQGPRARDAGARRLLHRERQPSHALRPAGGRFGVQLHPGGQQPAREGAQRAVPRMARRDDVSPTSRPRRRRGGGSRSPAARSRRSSSSSCPESLHRPDPGRTLRGCRHGSRARHARGLRRLPRACLRARLVQGAARRTGGRERSQGRRGARARRPDVDVVVEETPHEPVRRRR